MLSNFGQLSVLLQLVVILNMVSGILQILNNYLDGMKSCVPRNSLLEDSFI